MSAKVGYWRESDNLADAIEVKSEELRVKSEELSEEWKVKWRVKSKKRRDAGGYGI